MMSGYLSRMEDQKFEELIMIHDAGCGLKAAIAIHSTLRGPALGGTRMWSYPSEEEAIDDLMYLARAMSYKSAAADLPVGGGKGVIIGDPERDKCKELFQSYGRYINKLSGRFYSGKDMGVDEEDLTIMREVTDYVIGGKSIGSPSPYTAYGVWKGIKACAEEVYGSPSLEGKVVAIQGVGSVGEVLCRLLAEDGASLVVCDLDQKRAEEIRKQWGSAVVSPEEIYSQECNIFSPCAGGGVVNDNTLPLLKCDIIAGAANNIYKSKDMAGAIAKRGILYAPDYMINAGGLIFVEMIRQGISDVEKIKTEVARIEGRLKELFRRVRSERLLPGEIADVIAEEKLQLRKEDS